MTSYLSSMSSMSLCPFTFDQRRPSFVMSNIICSTEDLVCLVLSLVFLLVSLLHFLPNSTSAAWSSYTLFSQHEDGKGNFTPSSSSSVVPRTCSSLPSLFLASASSHKHSSHELSWQVFLWVIIIIRLLLMQDVSVVTKNNATASRRQSYK